MLKKPYDLRHPITYKRQTEPFDVEWYKNEDKKELGASKSTQKIRLRSLARSLFFSFGYKKAYKLFRYESVSK